MGLITDLVRMKSEQNLKAKQGAIEASKLVLTNPDATPEAREWATSSITDLLSADFGKTGGGKGSGGGKSKGGGKGGGGGGGLGEVFHGLITGLTGGLSKVNPYSASGGVKEGVREIEQKRPQRLLMTPEESAQRQESIKLQGQQREFDQQQKQAAQKAASARARLDSVKDLISSEEYRHALAEIEGGIKLPAAQPRPVVTRDVINPATGKASVHTVHPDGTETWEEEAPRPTAPKTASDREITWEAYATKHGKKAGDLTALEKLKAESEGKAISGKPKAAGVAGVAGGPGGSSTGGAGGMGIPNAKPVPGGSRYNPGGDLTVDTMAWEFINTGHVPFTGMGSGGKGSVNKREMAIGRAGEILKGLGISPAELPSIRGSIKANSAALARVTSLGAMVQQFENTVDKNMKTARDLSAEFNRTGIPLANRLLAAWTTGTGGTKANNFAAQMHALAQEWAKVMQGAASAGGAHVQSAQDAEKIMAPYLSNGQVEELFNKVIIPDMKNRSAAIDEEKRKLASELRSNIPGAGPGSGTTQNSDPLGVLK